MWKEAWGSSEGRVRGAAALRAVSGCGRGNGVQDVGDCVFACLVFSLIMCVLVKIEACLAL